MLDSLTPGQTLSCTVTKAPKRQDDRQTVARLMRQDADIKRALRHAHEHRMRTLVVRSRGKRPWAVRRKSARHAIPNEGATWTMRYIPHLRPELERVQQFVSITPA